MDLRVTKALGLGGVGSASSRAGLWAHGAQAESLRVPGLRREQLEQGGDRGQGGAEPLLQSRPGRADCQLNVP